MIGPTPKMLVTVLPEAPTAAVIVFLVSASMPSRRRRSAASSAATWCRAAATGPAGGLASSRAVAAAAVMALDTPPGMIWQSVACSRQAAWQRSRARSRCRLDQIFSTAAWSSAVSRVRAGERSAAMATDRASLGSFLFDLPEDSSRTREPSLGWTSRTSSPAARSCWASRCPSPRRPRPPRSAPATPLPSRSARLPGCPTRALAARRAEPQPHRSPPRYAIPYAGQRRSSLRPRTAPFRLSRTEYVTAAGSSNSRSVRRSHHFRATPRQEPASWQLVRKPDHACASRQSLREPAHRTPERYGQTRQRLTVFN